MTFHTLQRTCCFLVCGLVLTSLVSAADPVFKPFTRIQIKDAAGADVWEFKGKDDGCKIVDARERELFRVTRSEFKLKIKKPDDTVVGYVIVKPGEYKVVDATGKKELFELQRQSDNDWKWKDSKDQLLARIKKREYGFEIESPQQQSLFKSKLHDAKVSLRDPQEKTLFSSKDTKSTLAFVCLKLKPLDEGQQAGLMAAILWFEP